MEQTKREKKRCPNCGKFMDLDKKQLAEENKSLTNRLMVKDGRINALQKENEDLKGTVQALYQDIDKLEYAKRELEYSLEKIQSRGFFARLFNL